jgi:DNA segregation ATPase FtsK/SpoIIIE-like protein
VASPEDAKVATGLAATGAERLLGQGDFIVVAKGQVSRLQTAYLSTGEIERLVSWLICGVQPLFPPGATESIGIDSRSRLPAGLPSSETLLGAEGKV